MISRWSFLLRRALGWMVMKLRGDIHDTWSLPVHSRVKQISIASTVSITAM